MEQWLAQVVISAIATSKKTARPEAKTWMGKDLPYIGEFRRTKRGLKF